MGAAADIGRTAEVAVLVSALAARYVDERARRQEIMGTTPVTFRSVLSLFARAIGDPPASKLSSADIRLWLASLRVAPATVRIRLSTVRTFCDWLVDLGVLEANPCAGIRGPRQPRAVPRALSGDAVARILAEVPDSRGRLIVLLMVQEGLRATEVAHLELADVDTSSKTLIVVGKGGNQRMLPLSDETAAALDEYLAEHPATAGHVIRAVPPHPPTGVTPAYISKLTRRWMYDAGVKAKARDGVSGHALRHTAASDVLRATGGNVVVVQLMLGHQSLATTQRYLRTYPEELRVAMAGRTYRPGAPRSTAGVP